MKIQIELDVDVSGMDEDYIHDVVADWTYEMRSSKRLMPGSWKIDYKATGEE